jgi:glycosyltransferase involved in cell wall biosynthesis
VPVLASDRGGLPELVGDGAALPAEDLGAWTAALTGLWRDPSARQEHGARARERAREELGESRHYEQLIGLYRELG